MFYTFYGSTKLLLESWLLFYTFYGGAKLRPGYCSILSMVVPD